MKNSFSYAAITGLLIILLTSVITAQETGCRGTSGLTTGEITEILKAHNTVRQDHKVPLLTWDCKLAEVAQEWATRGAFEHRTGVTFGESLFVSAKANTKVKAAVHQWMLEKESWDNQTASCSAGRICTHYTQVVWKKTATVGCGVNRDVRGRWKVLIVCNYEPAGNTGGPPF